MIVLVTTPYTLSISTARQLLFGIHLPKSYQNTPTGGNEPIVAIHIGFIVFALFHTEIMS